MTNPCFRSANQRWNSTGTCENLLFRSVQEHNCSTRKWQLRSFSFFHSFQLLLPSSIKIVFALGFSSHCCVADFWYLLELGRPCFERAMKSQRWPNRLILWWLLGTFVVRGWEKLLWKILQHFCCARLQRRFWRGTDFFNGVLQMLRGKKTPKDNLIGRSFLH